MPIVHCYICPPGMHGCSVATGVLLLAALINSTPPRILARVIAFSIFWHFSGVIVLVRAQASLFDMNPGQHQSKRLASLWASTWATYGSIQPRLDFQIEFQSISCLLGFRELSGAAGALAANNSAQLPECQICVGNIL